MEKAKPDLYEFKIQIEKAFGQPLTTLAAIATEDFWNNWTAIANGILEGLIKANVDMIMLRHNFPEIRRKRDARKFWEKLIDDVHRNPNSGGMVNLCAHYIAGTIQLASGIGQAHWPQYPSNVITGNCEFITS